MGLKAPIKQKYLDVLERFVFPLLKNKNMKHVTFHLKTFLVKISEVHENIIKILLKYLNKTWPIRFPEKILFFIEIFESVIKN